MELKGSKTEQNLMTAFAGESQARNKYTYYASKAKKEGYNQIAALFEETANNEKEHAKIWFKLLHDGQIADTLTNLADAAAGENYEWTDMYAGFAATAEEEGFTNARPSRSGSAPTAATSTSASTRPRSAPSVTIRRATSFCRRRTTEPFLFGSR